MKLNKLTNHYMRTKVAGYLSKGDTTRGQFSRIRLDLGENQLGCSPKVLSCLANMAPEALMHYADPGNARMKEILSALYGVSRSNITLANSSNEIIDYLPKMILEPKERVLTLTPTFFRHVESSVAAGAEVIEIPLQEKDDFHFTDDATREIVDRVNRLDIKLVWLCTPNNPTGIVLPLSHIETIVRETSAMVIVDEAFYEFYDVSNAYSGARLVNKYKNIIVLRTMSKAYGLAGLRLGYAIAHEHVIAKIEMCRNTLVMTSSIAQQLARAALSDQEWLMRSVNQNKQLRKMVEQDINKLTGFHIIPGSQANIYLLTHATVDVYEKLKTQGVITADFRGSMGLEKKGYVRITVGNESANRALVSALKNI